MFICEALHYWQLEKRCGGKECEMWADSVDRPQHHSSDGQKLPRGPDWAAGTNLILQLFQAITTNAGPSISVD